MTDADLTLSAPASPQAALDPELAPPKRGEGSLLEALRVELTAELDEELDPMEVPERRGFAVVYSKAITAELLKAWQRRAKDGKNIDPLRLSAIILASQCRRILHRGVLVTAGSEEPVTFRDAAFLELYGVGRAVEAVRAFYLLDGHVLSAADELVKAAGFGADLDDADIGDLEDPTPAS